MWKKAALMLLPALMLLLPLRDAYGDEDTGIDFSHVTAAVLYEAQTGTVLVEHNAQDQHYGAGLMRMPVLLALAEAFDEGALLESAEMPVDAAAAAVPGPTAFLENGERIAAGELMKAAVMIGAGDAIAALSAGAFGSESVTQQNILLALRLGGVERQSYQYLGTGEKMSALELAKVAASCAKSAAYLKYAARYTDEILHPDGRRTELVNANRLVRFYPGCGGLMTGSEQQQNYCGAFYATRNGTSYVAVVLGASDAGTRSKLAETMLDYGFDRYRVETLALAGTVVLPEVPVRGGDVKKVNLIARENAFVLVPRSSGSLTEETDIPEYLQAPVLSSAVYGTATYKSADGSVNKAVPLYAEVDVEAFGIKEILARIILDFVA